MAWYNTAPSDAKGKKLATRLEKLTDEGGQPSYPERPLFEHVIGWLFEAGPCMAGGMASAPLSHGEIRAWMDNTGQVLTPWEVKTLRRLSSDYLAAAQEAEKPECKAPFSDPETAKKLSDAELEKKLDLFFS